MKNTAQQNAMLAQLQTALQHHQAGHLLQADAIYKKFPANPDALHLSGVVAYQLGKNAKAIELINKAIRLHPRDAAYYSNIGLAYHALNRFDEAAGSYRKALNLKPDYAEAQNNLGNVFKEQDKLIEAEAFYQKAISLNSHYADAYSNLGVVLVAQGKNSDAVAAFQKALTLDPSDVDAYDNLLFASLYSANYTAAQLFEMHCGYSERFETPFISLRKPHANLREPSKKLKIGYLSADFCRHAVAYFIEPVLAHHDKSQVEIFCYYNHSNHDGVTDRIKALADHWLLCKGLSDDDLAQRIRDDGIDILVDLSGHSNGNRLLVFARKPAPVQVTYLGYPGTTGLKAIDYRITDNYLDPPEWGDQFNSEKCWRLPDMVSCYLPGKVGLAVIDHPPLDDNGFITFGCFNNFSKVTDAVMQQWGRILSQLAGARLMLEIRGIDNPVFKAEVEARFARCGVAPERLIMLPRRPENQYVLYNKIDIALDPFPYNGGTTSFDTLWMGVPFISLAGNHCVSRLGVSTLTVAGLPELIAATENDYVNIAVDLAQDTASLRKIRDGLRARVSASPLMDAPRFIHHMETAYRTMWQRWCEAGN